MQIMQQYMSTTDLQNTVLELQQLIKTNIHTDICINYIIKLCEISVKNDRLDVFDFIYDFNYVKLSPTSKLYLCTMDYKDILNHEKIGSIFPKQLTKYIFSKKCFINAICSNVLTSDRDNIFTCVGTVVKNNDDMTRLISLYTDELSRYTFNSLECHGINYVILDRMGVYINLVRSMKTFLDTTTIKFSLEYKKSIELTNMMYIVNFYDSIENKTDVDNIAKYFLQKIDTSQTYNICIACILLKLNYDIDDELMIKLMSYNKGDSFYSNTHSCMEFRNKILMDYCNINNYTELRTKKLVNSIVIQPNNLFVCNMLEQYPSMIDETLFDKLIGSTNNDAIEFCIMNKYILTPLQIDKIINICDYRTISLLVNFYGLSDKMYLKKILLVGSNYTTESVQKYVILFEGKLEKSDIIECIVMTMYIGNMKCISHLLDPCGKPYFTKNMTKNIFSSELTPGPDAIYNIIYRLRLSSLSFTEFSKLIKLCREYKYNIQYDDLVKHIITSVPILRLFIKYPDLCDRI